MINFYTWYIKIISLQSHFTILGCVIIDSAIHIRRCRFYLRRHVYLRIYLHTSGVRYPIPAMSLISCGVLRKAERFSCTNISMAYTCTNVSGVGQVHMHHEVPLNLL